MTEQYVIGAFIGWVAHAWFMRVHSRVVAKQRAEKIARSMELFSKTLQEATARMKAAQEERAKESPFVRPVPRGRG